MNMDNFVNSDFSSMACLSLARTRSISPENPTGEPGQGGRSIDGPAYAAARDLGQGWKVSPYVIIPAGTTHTLADISGEGEIQQIWITLTGNWRYEIIRFYWDEDETPAIEVPAGDFFCMANKPVAQVTSQIVCVNPGSAFNCYWKMPFRKHARITLENLNDTQITAYYQINYALGRIPENAGYLQAEFRRSNPLPYKQVHTLLDGIYGIGHYAGTYIAWGVNNCGWWGEGEIKFYLDGDKDFPTICGTGTEDYFCGSYNFENPVTHRYQEYCTPYAGMPQVIRPDGLYVSQQRFGLYRWHIQDPIRFAENIRVTIQALGWRSGGRYLPLQDDISSTAFFYLDKTSHTHKPLPDRDGLEII